MSGRPLTYGMECQLPVTLTFEVDEKISLPVIKDIPLKDVYDNLAVFLGVTDYETNLASFWLLDVLSAALQRAQTEFMISERYQRVLIAWFGFMFEYVREGSLSREEVFRELEARALEAATSAPSDGGGSGRPRAPAAPGCGDRSQQLPGSPREIVAILEILYGIFANPFAFALARTAFGAPPEVVVEEFPYTVHSPKKLRRPAPAPGKAPTNKSTKTTNKSTKTTKGDSKTGKNKSPGSERERSADVALAPPDNINEYILPLKEAVTQEFFNRIFHPDKFLKEKKESSSTKGGKSTADTKSSVVTGLKTSKSKIGDKSGKIKTEKNDDVRKKRKGK